jgi:spermidine/putrescine transport system permease protein
VEIPPPATPTPSAPRRRPPRAALPHTLLATWTAIVLLFLYLPIAILVIYSFNDSRLTVAWAGFTTRWYRELGSNAPLIAAGLNSLLIAAAVMVLSVFLGTLGAWALYRYRWPLGGFLRTLVAVPLVMPDVIMGVSLLILFAVFNAWGNTVLPTMGFADDHLGLGFATVVIGHVTFCFPFVLVAVHARLVGMDPALEEAAMDLGATPTRAFLRVIVPYLMPAIVSGGLMAFTLSMDELIVTYFISGPQSVTLPVKVFGMARVGLSPTINAVSALFVAATTLLVVSAMWLQRIKESGR